MKTKTGALPNSAGFPGTNMVKTKQAVTTVRKEIIDEKPPKNFYIYW